jgi:hypothetical protein
MALVPGALEDARARRAGRPADLPAAAGALPGSERATAPPAPPPAATLPDRPDPDLSASDQLTLFR